MGICFESHRNKKSDINSNSSAPIQQSPINGRHPSNQSSPNNNSNPSGNQKVLIST
jgi:hypothetical protein